MWGLIKLAEMGGSCLCTFQIPYIVHGVIPTGSADLHIFFDILLESSRFLKMMLVCFSMHVTLATLTTE